MSCNNNNDRNSGNNNLTSLLGAQLLGAAVERQSIAPDHAKAAAAVAAAQVHMNGTSEYISNVYSEFMSIDEFTCNRTVSIQVTG